MKMRQRWKEMERFKVDIKTTCVVDAVILIFILFFLPFVNFIFIFTIS